MQTTFTDRFSGCLASMSGKRHRITRNTQGELLWTHSAGDRLPPQICKQSSVQDLAPLRGGVDAAEAVKFIYILEQVAKIFRLSKKW